MSSTDTMVIALVMILCISAVYTFGQMAIIEINPENNASSLYNCNSGLLSGAGYIDCSNPNGNYILSNSSAGDLLPLNQQSVDSSGNIFADTFASAKAWLKESVFGRIGLLFDIISAPYNIIKVFTTAGGLPSAFAVVFGGIFYILLIFIFSAWVLGR